MKLININIIKYFHMIPLWKSPIKLPVELPVGATRWSYRWDPRCGGMAAFAAIAIARERESLPGGTYSLHSGSPRPKNHTTLD